MTHTPMQAVANSPEPTYRAGSVTSEMELLAKRISELHRQVENLEGELDHVRIKSTAVSGEAKEPSPSEPPRCMLAECIAGASMQIKVLTEQVRALSNQLQLK